MPSHARLPLPPHSLRSVFSLPYASPLLPTLPLPLPTHWTSSLSTATCCWPHHRAPLVLLRPKCHPPTMTADLPRRGHNAHHPPAVLSSAPAMSTATQSPSGCHTAITPSLVLLHLRLLLAGIIVHPRSSSALSAAHP
jgi:hypothetical protein